MKRFLSFLMAVCMLLGCAATASAGRAINDLEIKITADASTVAVGTPVTITYEVTGGCEPYYVYASGTYYYSTEKSDDLRGGDLNKWFNVEIANSAAAAGTITIVPTEGTRMDVSIDVLDGNDESAYASASVEITGSAAAPAVSVSITPNGTLDNVKFGDTVSADYTVTSNEELGYLSAYVDQFGPGNVHTNDATALTGTITDTIRTGTNQFDFDISLNTLNSDWSLFRYTKQFRADPTGSLGVAGWRKVGDYWYYGDDAGTPTTGWKNINGYWYYFGSTGVMSADQTGYSYGDNGEQTRQYLGEDGRMVANTWFEKYNSWYYADPAGNLAEGWSNIGGLWYYFNSSNHMLTGWHRLGGTWYYLNQDSGVMETGWKQENGVWMYLNDDGSMTVSSWKKIGGTWYYFDASGAMATGWQHIDDLWYYFNASGAMLSGWQEIGGVWYYFDASGAMATGWRNLGNWFFFNASGAMATGWQQIGGTWYYFYANGAMATGWQEIGGTWYYFYGSGAMVTGSAEIDGRMSIFSDGGAWLGYAD